MTRYLDEDIRTKEFEQYGYREGVDRVLTYIESINRYPALVAELKWAINEGII